MQPQPANDCALSSPSFSPFTPSLTSLPFCHQSPPQSPYCISGRVTADGDLIFALYLTRKDRRSGEIFVPYVLSSWDLLCCMSVNWPYMVHAAVKLILCPCPAASRARETLSSLSLFVRSRSLRRRTEVQFAAPPASSPASSVPACNQVAKTFLPRNGLYCQIRLRLPPSSPWPFCSWSPAASTLGKENRTCECR